MRDFVVGGMSKLGLLITVARAVVAIDKDLHLGRCLAAALAVNESGIGTIFFGSQKWNDLLRRVGCAEKCIVIVNGHDQ